MHKSLWAHVLANVPGDNQMAKYDNLNVMSPAFFLEAMAKGIEQWTQDNAPSSASASSEQSEDPKPTT